MVGIRQRGVFETCMVESSPSQQTRGGLDKSDMPAGQNAEMTLWLFAMHVCHPLTVLRTSLCQIEFNGVKVAENTPRPCFVG